MNKTPQEQGFGNLALSPELLQATKAMGYTSTTKIQDRAIPLLLSGQDIIGHSSTGTGKTAAFGIPAVEGVNACQRRPQVLVLAPTRELAVQISAELERLARYKGGVTVATVYGGASMRDQINQLKRANMVVGTPGRLMDHLRRRTLLLDDIGMVILDEADEMLSRGFIDDIKTILSSAPQQRQTALFSATLSKAILSISQEFLQNPKIVDVMDERDNQSGIKQTYYYVAQRKKREALALLLQHTGAERSIVFCNTRRMVDDLTSQLRAQGFGATGLHGDMDQSLRTRVMSGFRTGAINVLVATDVAARGIDVDDVETVINFDLPQSFEYYVHRIGRTGRAGKKGVSQTLICDSRQLSTLRRLMDFTGSTISEQQFPSSDAMIERAVARAASELVPQMQGAPGAAAQMLVRRLMGDEQSGITAEQVACILAEKLLGGDERYASGISAQDCCRDKQQASGRRQDGHLGPRRGGSKRRRGAAKASASCGLPSGSRASVSSQRRRPARHRCGEGSN